MVQSKRSRGVTTVIKVHPRRTMNSCIDFHGNPSPSCWDGTLRSTNVDLSRTAKMNRNHRLSSLNVSDRFSSQNVQMLIYLNLDQRVCHLQSHAANMTANPGSSHNVYNLQPFSVKAKVVVNMLRFIQCIFILWRKIKISLVQFRLVERVLL